MRIKNRNLKTAVSGLIAAMACGAAAQGQTAEALMDALVKKGILTEQEAEDIKADLSKENRSANKWKVSSSLNELELFGDARLRYEWREGQNDLGDTNSRERFRYRLRFGFKGKYKEDFYYGLRFETSNSSRSTNVTFADDGGPWNKDSDRLNVGQLYLGWKKYDWLAIEAGRIPNPFVTTSMVWDSDINPEGAAEKFSYDMGKTTFFANLGQFLYDDENPENSIGATGNKSDTFMFGWQTGVKHQFTETLSFQVAPTLYNYSGHGDSNGFPTDFGPGNLAGINDLLIFNVPMELNYKGGVFEKHPLKLWADVALNLDADERARKAGFADADDQNMAWQLGVQLGKAGKKGTWEVRAFYQHSELFSLDNNLVDSDLFDSRLNLHGFGVGGSYSIRDNIAANLLFAMGDRIKKDLFTGGGGDVAANPLNDYRILQLDLTWKF